MRREQIVLDKNAFDEASIKRDLIKALLQYEIASIDTSLDDDKFSIMVYLKKSIISEDALASVKRNIVRFFAAHYPGLMSFRSLGVAFDSNKLVVVCLFEMTE